jgi:hypothetical protein
MSNTTFMLYAQKMGGVDANNYVGRSGEVFYDTDGNSPVRISDGETPGGRAFAITSNRVSFNPQFTANGNTVPGVSTTGSYVKQGLITHFRVNVNFANCNAASFNVGGQYQVVLPFPSVATITIRSGTLHQTNGDARYHIAGILDLDDSPTDSNNILKLYYSGSTTDLAWKNTTPVGATSNTSHFDISGAYDTNTIFG